MNKEWRPKDVPNRQELERKKKLIKANNETYKTWRATYEKGILRAVREFVAGDGCVAVVPVPQGKEESLHSKT